MLKVTNLGKEYGDKVALNDIDLTFPDKGLVIIKGESGSGKTTLLNMLTVLDYPTRGKIMFNGVEITPKNSEAFRMKYCGNIYQDYMLMEDLSVKDNIEISLQACGQEYTLDDIKNLLDKVDLPQEYLEKKASKLSGGEKQRVAIARAVAKNDAMIFADEPTGNLDSKNGKKVMTLLKDISKDRLVVVVSHNEKYNVEYADYTVALEDGVVQFCNLPSEQSREVSVSFDRKSRLKPKTVASLAFWGFEKNKVKTVVSIIVFVVLAIFSMISTVAYIGDSNLAYARSLDKCDKKNVLLKEDGEFLSINFEDFDFDNLEKFKDNLDYGVSDVFRFNMRFYNLYGEEIDYDKSDEFYSRYSRSVSLTQLIVYDPTVGADVEVKYGNLPKRPNDIMLPYCYAQYISRVCRRFQCDDVAELIGREYLVAVSGFDKDVEHYSFNICGIFEEGDYYTDYDSIDFYLTEYYWYTNQLVSSAFVSPEAKEIMFDNAYIFNGQETNGQSFCTFYQTTQIKGAQIKPYAYDRYSNYATRYEPLAKGEVYMASSLAQSLGLSVGDTLSDTLLYHFKMTTGETFEDDFDGLVVKDIFDLPDKLDFVIFSKDDYYSKIVFDASPKAFWGYYFNAKGVKDTYKFFNSILKEGSKLGIFTSGYLEDVYTENIKEIGTIYTILVAFKNMIWLPVMLLSYIGMAAMGFVSFGYLISSKAKSYNVLRSLGFGKKNISVLLLAQIFAVILIESIIGVFLGWLSCNLLGRVITSFVLPGVPLSIADEVMMPIGFVAPIVFVLFSLALGGIIALVKARAIFAKSIIENKTS